MGIIKRWKTERIQEAGNRANKAMKKKHTVGIIGCGTIANAAHIPGYTRFESARIGWFCDIIPDRAQAAAEGYGSGKITEDYREVLADPQVDCVSLCVPNYLHAEMAIAALRAGKHVLCEKPAGCTFDEVLEMRAAQHVAGRILNIGVVNRFNDAVNKIRRYIRSGRLGEVYHVYISFRSPRSIPGLGGPFTTKALSGGGALIDWGVHFLDLVMYCCGDPAPVTVSAECFSRLGQDISGYAYKTMWAGPPVADGTFDVEEAVTALIRTKGPVLTMQGAWAQNIFEEEMYIDFMGDLGGIRMQYGKDFTVYTAEEGALVHYKPEFEARNPYDQEIASFLHSIETGEKNAAHIDNVIVTAKIMQAVYDSAAAHREVEI